MLRQGPPAILALQPSVGVISQPTLSPQYITITSENSNVHQWVYIETLYAQSGIVNLHFNNITTEDFLRYFCSDRHHLSKLRINALALSYIPLNIIEFIIANLLARPVLELTHLKMMHLLDKSVRVIYDFLLYLAHKGKNVDLECGNEISQNWLTKFQDLFNPMTLSTSISKEFHALMTARFSDRYFYTNKFHEYEAALTMQYQEKHVLVAQLVNKSQAFDMLNSQIQMLTEDKEQSKKDSAAKEAALLAQIESLQTQLTAQQTEKESLKKAAAENEASLQHEITQLLKNNEILTQGLSQLWLINEKFPALFPLNSEVQPPERETIAQSSSSTSTKMSPKTKTTTAEAKPSLATTTELEDEKSHESFYALLRAAENGVDQKLKDKLRLLATNWLASRYLKNKIELPIDEYLHQQLETAENIIASGASFYAIPDGKAESIFHYLAFILCKISDTPAPFEDHQHERKALLQTIENTLAMIEDLHKRFVSQGITLHQRKAEIDKLKTEMTQLIATNGIRHGFFNSTPTMAASSSSSSSPPERRLG
jgi:hypothetical protein